MAPNLCEAARGRIIGQWEKGSSAAEIAASLNISIKSVRRWIGKYREGGIHALHQHERTGRNPATTVVDDLHLQQYVQDNPFTNVTDATRLLDFPASASTGRRRLRAAGIHCYRPARKLLLSHENREQRVAYALDNLTTSREDWEITIWTDEKVFDSSINQIHHVWRPTDSRFHPDYVVPTNRYGRVTCGVWGWISGHTMGELVPVTRRMNSAEYISILEEVLLPSVRSIYPADEMPLIRLVQDNSGVHTSHLTQAWFRAHPEIDLVAWPARSPDLNLIENVWAEMTRRWVPARERTAAALLDHARQVWEDLRAEPDFLANLTNSIPNRLDQVIERGGYACDY